MNVFRSNSYRYSLLCGLLFGSLAVWAPAQAPKTRPASGAKQNPTARPKRYPPVLLEQGSALFKKDCSFCHGRDAAGGEHGPDLTRSRLVTQDVDGNKIGPVVRNGRPEKGMPRFARSDEQIAGLVAFLHTLQSKSLGRNGGRRGVDPADLQTGNAEAGKQYFNGAGGCAGCHSPTGDLASIASRYKGLDLEKRMLYPTHAKSRVTVTLASGQTIEGTQEYLDEFTVGLIDSTGTYRSWRTRDVHYEVDAPANAHVDLFSKYTDDDIHNLMAYLQTLH